jgi:UDP-glucuronate decarboxylase
MNPAAALGHSKRAAEFFCAAYAQEFGLKVKMTRCFSFLGPHLPLDIHYAIGNFIRDGLLRRPISVKGDGRPVRSYLYMSDLVVWLMTILFRGEPSRIYNVGSEDGRSIRELAEVVGRCFDPVLPVEMLAAPVSSPATAAPDIYVPCTRRVRAELGLDETVSLEEGIQKTLAFSRVTGS